MCQVIRILLFAFILILWQGAGESPAWSLGKSNTLLTIDGDEYTVTDFKNWWQNWKEDDEAFPETPGPFVDWLLLVNESKRMELFLEPTYQHKVDVFLRVRSLMMLKYDEVDSKTNITDKDLMDRYTKKYIPRSEIQVFYFNTVEKANQVYDLLSLEKSKIEEIIKQSAIHGAEVFYQEKRLRPIKTMASWDNVLSALEVGDISKPFAWEKGFVLVKLVKREGFTAEDFEANKKKIVKEVRRIRESELSVKLINTLKVKYELNVNKDLYEGLDITADNEDIAEESIITTNRGNVPARVFIDEVKDMWKIVDPNGKNAPSREDMKERVLNGIISQALTEWEAKDRHYEEKSASLKPVYDFYVQHRLIKELEKRIFTPKGIVTDEEIASYYHEQIDDYTVPEKVSVIILNDLGDNAEKIWAEILTGNDFAKVAAKYFPGGVGEEMLAINDLDPVIRAEVKKLGKGEVSYPFIAQGKNTILKLIDWTAGMTISLKNAANDIYERLRREKVARARADYLGQLKSMSEIVINEKAWGKILKEFSGDNV